MEWWQAIVLGLVEGITEFLPISSTGHLILAERAMRIGDDVASRAFSICIQAGAIVAVLGLYRARAAQMWNGVLGRDARGRRLFALLVVAFVPAGVCALLFKKQIERHLFGLWPVVAAFFIGGLAIVLFERHRTRSPQARTRVDDVTSLSFGTALAIGAWQSLALWPGTSRSLVTIFAGLLVGLSMSAAVEFSLLLGLLTLLAATAHEALGHGPEMLREYGALNIVLGFACAAISAFASVRWMVAFLQRRGLMVFGVYRVAVALLVALLLATRVLSAH